MAIQLMNTLFYSLDGTSWNIQGPGVGNDKQKVVTIPVRQYTYRNTQYIVLACADVNSPSDVFYQLVVRRPIGEGIPSTPDRDARTMKRLLEYAPLTIGDFKATEYRLLRKIANKRRHEFVERMKVQYHGGHIPVTQVTENEVHGRNAKQLDTDVQDMQASLIVPHNATATHHSNVPRVFISDVDLSIIKALIQDIQQNVNEEEEVLPLTASLKESMISMEESRGISDMKCGNNKLLRDLSLNLDVSRYLAVRRERYKRPSITRMDAFVIKAIQYLVQCLFLQSGNSIKELQTTLTVMMDKNIIEGLFQDQCQKLVGSVDYFRQAHFPIPFQMPGLGVSTGGLRVIETQVSVTKQGRSQLQHEKFNLQVSGETTASQIYVTMKDGNSMTVAKQTEPARGIVGENEDDLKNLIDDDDDENIGGILGVFCRSSIHGDYSGVVIAEKKLG